MIRKLATPILFTLATGLSSSCTTMRPVHSKSRVAERATYSKPGLTEAEASKLVEEQRMQVLLAARQKLLADLGYHKEGFHLKGAHGFPAFVSCMVGPDTKEINDPHFSYLLHGLNQGLERSGLPVTEEDDLRMLRTMNEYLQIRCVVAELFKPSDTKEKATKFEI